MDVSYRTVTYRKSIRVAEYVHDYVDVPKFLAFCKECQNYNKVWSCPPFSFDVLQYWQKYSTLDLIGIKIVFLSDLANKKCAPKELKIIVEKSLGEEKKKLVQYLLAEEERHAGSVSLSAGNCKECGEGNCTRSAGQKCRQPKRMRHSIESLGGDVGKTTEKLLQLPLQWLKDDTLPPYLTLLGGLLKKA